MNERIADPYAPPVADVDGGVLEPLTANVVLADRGTRLGAVILDRLLVVPLVIPGVVLGVIFQSPATIIAGCTLPLLGLVAYQWYLIATTGQSLAKRWLGIRIVRQDGSPVNFGSGVAMRSIVPTVMSWVPYLGFAFYLVDVLMIFRDDRRCVHDHIAGTKVIALR